MEATNMFTRFCRTVLLHILRQGKHQGLAIVEDIDFLALLFGEVQREHHGSDSHHSAKTHEDNSEKTYLPERRLDVFQ